MGVLRPLKIIACKSITTDMKKFGIENENVERHFSPNEKQNGKTANAKSKGTVTIEEKYGTLMYERRLSHPREIVWKAITDPKEI